MDSGGKSPSTPTAASPNARRIDRYDFACGFLPSRPLPILAAEPLSGQDSSPYDS
jgi:hypothetical protein